MKILRSLNMTSRTYILQAFVETPWAILPSKLAVLEEIVARHVAGEKLEAEEIQARIHGASRPVQRQVNSVAVLPLFGTIFPRANLMTEMSGATSAESFGANFAKLLDNPDVDAIVLDVNSPGGSVYGVQEVSKMIFDARGRKPIVAVANHMMASAAYWIASAADEIVVTPSGDVGSIGVFAVHQDMSAALEKAGLNLSLISAGKYKVEGNPWQPLGEEARAAIQASVDETYDAFLEAVARNRGVKAATVRNGFGEGRVVGAEEAVKLGMADRVATLEETINRLFGIQGAGDKGIRGDGSENKELEISNSSSGQAPGTDQSSPMQEARARLALVANKEFSQGETSMNNYVRELLKQRSEKVARAQALVETADKEGRDFSEEERAEFVKLLGEGSAAGEIGALDAKIEQVQGEREKLRAAAAKSFGGSPAGNESVKPDGKGSNSMKRSEFDNLDPAARAAFVKNNGKIED
jgi:capsid assembly protease